MYCTISQSDPKLNQMVDFIEVAETMLRNYQNHRQDSGLPCRFYGRDND